MVINSLTGRRRIVAPPTPITPPTSLSQESAGELSVMVSRTMGASGVVDLEYVTHDLSAESGVHYTAIGEGEGTLQFNPHEVF